ncbi:AraC family transcriptional regulator [Marinilongibacter aquaticus]|uniref:helix-turn-helix domain-containing protein n=1 Tax=Marinilongibacter aquaticus TaxID=2975157 RepID=UPI0021BD3B04|nr:AraC family transcriptional regulator [Marinilongibacter aquaticus]UBM59582.1 AraC family transcriptional regulator [Marinilongibacter aquaticus]
MEIKSCYIGPEISPEQFIPEHMFWYVVEGEIKGYDGQKNYIFKSGDAFIARKNHLFRYNKLKINGKQRKVVVLFDEEFLKRYQKSHHAEIRKFKSPDAILPLNQNKGISQYIQSLMPHYTGSGRIDKAVAEGKREELLSLLLILQPQLSSIFFDYGIPGKIDLKKFITHNYKFNVKLERLAFLTGRSLSAFKRDFKEIFNDTPNRWLMQKRLQEAHFLIDKKNKKPSEIYLDLGFEDLSHFSFAFKKMFGKTPREIIKKNSPTNTDK